MVEGALVTVGVIVTLGAMVTVEVLETAGVPVTRVTINDCWSCCDDKTSRVSRSCSESREYLHLFVYNLPFFIPQIVQLHLELSNLYILTELGFLKYVTQT